MRSWRSTRGRRPTTSAGTCSAPGRSAEAAVAEVEGEPVGFALWFTTFSTFRGRPGSVSRGPLRQARIPRAGDRQGAAGRPGPTGRRARLRAAGMVGAELERAGDRLLP